MKAEEDKVYTKGFDRVWTDKEVIMTVDNTSTATLSVINDVLPYAVNDKNAMALMTLIIIIRCLKLLSFFDIFQPACAAVLTKK